MSLPRKVVNEKLRGWVKGFFDGTVTHSLKPQHTTTAHYLLLHTRALRKPIHRLNFMQCSLYK